MATINSRTLFLTTSPRTPEKIIPEIALLENRFKGETWNQDTQSRFMKALREEAFFNGQGENAPALSARDRINRAPKSLGFVQLKPTIQLTPAGHSFVSSERKEEVLLRQLLKFQIPSPYHKPSATATKFCVKPYLELLRLVHYFGTLKFDELQIFGMQLTDWHKFGDIVKKIEDFRSRGTCAKQGYKKYKQECLNRELLTLFTDRISSGDTKTRESDDTSLSKFLATKAGNLRDYADASFRYLRSTGLVTVSNEGKSLSIAQANAKDVDFILNTIERTPATFADEKEYLDYLGAADTPMLLTDDKNKLTQKINDEFPDVKISSAWDIYTLKNVLANNITSRKNTLMNAQIDKLKNFVFYDDIQEKFKRIKSKELFDAPLMLEWNAWRGMTMLDGGFIKANLTFDDFGQPMSTAPGNVPDIVCDYGEFLVTVEVTLATGQKQYETEGEPVSRHVGKLRKESGKPCYCLFLAPSINEACRAHFFMLYKTEISFYGGKSTIVPLPLAVFQKMLEDSRKASFTPSPANIRSFFEYSTQLANSANDEREWHDGILNRALNWLPQDTPR